MINKAAAMKPAPAWRPKVSKNRSITHLCRIAVKSPAKSRTPITQTSGNRQSMIPEMKSSSSPTRAAASPKAKTLQTGRLGPECASAPIITAVDAASSPAWSSSTVPRSSGAPGRLGNQAGRRIVTDPAQTNSPLNRVFFQETLPKLGFSVFGTPFPKSFPLTFARRMTPQILEPGLRFRKSAAIFVSP